MWKHPAVWTFAACWAAAAVWLSARGHGGMVAEWALRLAGVLLFCWITVRLTEPMAAPEPSTIPRWRLWLQVAMLAAVVGTATMWEGLHFHGVVSGPPVIPGWTHVANWCGKTAERLGAPYRWGANPAEYCLLPLMFLVPLTGLRYLGLGRGHRTVRVTLLWCAVPIAKAASFLLPGRKTFGDYLWRLASNTMQNGPFEEFLSRGAIQTRLQLLLGPAWGVTLASLAFGAWHLGLGFTQTGKQSLVDGLASTIVIQATLGLALGMIYLRTRNLVACSVFHVVSNATFG
jgi:hypothetical protein